MSINFPDPSTTQEFTGANGITYVWDTNDSKWIIKSAGSDSLYVQKTGDTMTGPLTMEDASEIQMTNTGLKFQVKGESLKDANGDPVLDADGDEQWDSQVNRFIDIESQTPRLIKSDGQVVQNPGKTGADLYGINFDLSGGNTYKNTLQASAKEGWIFKVTGGGTPTINFSDSFDLTKNPSYDIDNGVAIRGIPTPGENTPSDFAVNKDYVDTKDEELRQDIIEIEEELEAIAPSLERGTWVFNPIGAAGVGQYGLFALGTSTNEYPQADHLFINSIDSTGKIHNFDDVDEGTYLEIFSPTDGDYGLYQVVENNGETQGANAYWDFTLNHLQSNRLLADAEGTCRFKFFELAEGADPASFVKKEGDNMSGTLRIDSVNDGTDVTGSNAATKKLTFKTTKVDESDSRSVSLWQNGQSAEVIIGGGLRLQNILNSGTYYGYNKSAGGFYSPQIKLDSSKGVLKWSSTEALTWNSDKIQINYPVEAYEDFSFADGFVVKKANEPIDGDNVFQASPEYVRTYETVNADSDEFTVVPKKYVDEQIANIDISGGGISGDCVEINGGSLCAAEPNPRFYDVLSWTDNQKVGRKPFSTNRGSNYHFYSGTQNKWVYIYREGTSSTSTNKLRFSTADELDGSYTGSDYYRAIYNPSSDLNKFGTTYVVSGNYIYYHEVSSGASNSSTKKYRKVYAWDWTTNLANTIHSIYCSYTYSHSFYIDYKGNVYSRGYNAYYINSKVENQYYVGGHNPRTNETTKTEPSRTVVADVIPHLVPTTDTQAPGLWYWYGGTSTGLDTNNSSQLMYYKWTDENDEWQSKNITNRLPRMSSTFNSNTTSRSYVKTNKGPITRDLLWVYDAPGLKEDEAYVYGIFHSGSYPTKYYVDDNLTFDIWRAKVTISEIQDIDWLTLFDGGKKVFHGPGFCERLDYIAGEIVTRTRSGAVTTSSNTAGSVVQVYPDTVVAGTLDGGENWQQRPRNSKNPTERSYYAYRLFKGDNNVFQPYYSDEFTYYYVSSNYEIKPGTIANSEGKIDSEDYIDGVSGETGYFQLTFPYPISEGQPLYWNGVDIGKPFEPEDLNFHDYPPLPTA